MSRQGPGTFQAAEGKIAPRQHHGHGVFIGGLDVDDFGGSVPKLVKTSGARVWSPNHLDLEPPRIEEAHALPAATPVR